MESEDLAADLLRGVPAIAKFIGLPVRTTYYELERKKIPGFKSGKLWLSRKSTLRRHFDELEAGHRMITGGGAA